MSRAVIPLARCIGRKKALELLLYGSLIPAAEALALGLVNKLLLKDELETQARRWAEELAPKSPVAAQIAKSAFYNPKEVDYT